MTKSIKNVLIALFSVAFVFSLAFGLCIKTERTFADGELLTMNTVAQARIVPDDGTGLTNSGLKFTAQIEKTAYDALVDTYEKVEAGIIIVPSDYVDAAEGYTIDKLSTLEALDGKEYYKITEGFSLNDSKTHYLFSNSIITIKPANYNRDFTSVAFIKITESDAEKAQNLTDYILFDGAYYLYSNTNTANVYDVAYQTYENLAMSEEDTCAILQKYLDGVAVISGSNGEVAIANNGGEYYQSPFAIGKSSDGYYFVQNAPVALTYNGERIKTLSVIDNANKVKVYTDAVSSGATFNADGTVTLEGRKNTTGLGTFAPTNYDNSYIAFAGDYGVGTYIDFTFTGNNLPQVTLFANEINGCMGCGNTSDNYDTLGAKYTGFLIVNGWYTKVSWTQATGDVYETRFGDRVLMFGPERISKNANYMMSVANLAIASTVSEFEQDYLATDTSGTEYKYTVGSFVQDGVVYIEISITNLTTNVTQTKSKSTGLSKAECEALGGNIIAFGCVKEDYASGTTFAYSAPYRVEKTGVVSNGARYNKDGSVSLANKYPTNGIGWVGSVQKVDNSYVAFEGNYGVGTYIDFTFTGNNLPYVTLFANNITGDITGGGSGNSAKPVNNGYILMNGMYFEKDGSAVTSHDWANKYLACMGPDKYGIDYGDGTNTDINNNYNINENWLKNNLKVSSDKYFTQYYLRTDTSGIVYKYTVGSYVENNIVYIDVAIVNANTGEKLGSGKFNTGKTQTEIEAIGGNIIAYGCFKGGSDATTFTYSNPYTK